MKHGLLMLLILVLLVPSVGMGQDGERFENDYFSFDIPAGLTVAENEEDNSIELTIGEVSGGLSGDEIASGNVLITLNLFSLVQAKPDQVPYPQGLNDRETAFYWTGIFYGASMVIDAFDQSKVIYTFPETVIPIGIASKEGYRSAIFQEGREYYFIVLGDINLTIANSPGEFDQWTDELEIIVGSFEMK